MPFKLNPFTGTLDYAPSSDKWKESVATSSDLPSTGNISGDARVTLDTSNIWVWSGSSWIDSATGGGGGITQLTGDVTAGPSSGSAVATVAFVGGSTSANVHSAELLANAGTSANTVSTLVKRDSSGNFSAGTITASLTGHSSLDLALSGGSLTGATSITGSADLVQFLVKGNSTQTNDIFQVKKSDNTSLLTFNNSGNLGILGSITASNLSGSNTGDQTITLTGDVTGSGTGSFVTTVAFVGGSTSSDVHNATVLTNSATNADTASTIVRRDASKNFIANTITLETSLVLNGSTSGTFTQSANATTTSYSVKWPNAQGASSTFLSNDGSGNLSWVSGSGGATAPLTLTGSTDAVQLKVIGNGTQTSNIFEVRNSSNFVIASIDNDSNLKLNQQGAGTANITANEIFLGTLGGGSFVLAGDPGTWGTLRLMKIDSGPSPSLTNANGNPTVKFNDGLLVNPANSTSLDWFSRTLNQSSGAVIATWSSSGLTVNSGNLILAKHLKSTQSGTTTVAANANAGTGASASLANATDIAGQVSLTTGTISFSTGSQVDISFAVSYAVAPIVTLTSASSTAALNLVAKAVYVTSTTDGFSINFGVADLSSNTYLFNYHVIETQ